MPSYDLATAAAAVANPATSAADLATIAASFPGLRGQVAAHPNAYPDLLDWLAAQGDPSVVAVINARQASSASNAPVLKGKRHMKAIVIASAIVVVAVVATCLFVLLPKGVDPDGPLLTEAQVEQVLNSHTMMTWTTNQTNWVNESSGSDSSAASCSEVSVTSSVSFSWRHDGDGLREAGRAEFVLRSCARFVNLMTAAYNDDDSKIVVERSDIGLIFAGRFVNDMEMSSALFCYGNVILWFQFDATYSSLNDAMRAIFDGRTSADLMNDLVTTMNDVAAGRPV